VVKISMWRELSPSIQNFTGICSNVHHYRLGKIEKSLDFYIVPGSDANNGMERNGMKKRKK
jgi:hypothetical protein